MKSFVSLLAGLLMANLCIAQILEQQLVRVDYENNNALTRLATIPNSLWPEKEYCFDAEQGRYFFTSIATGPTDYVLSTVDVASGAVLSQVDVNFYNNPQGKPSYEYHEGEERIFALVPKNANGTGIDFHKVDPATGAYTFIQTIDDVINWNETVSTINAADDEYYLVYDLQRKLVRIKTSSGQKELEVPHDDNFFIRQIDYNSTDNTLVGLAKYNGDEYVSLIDIDPQTLVVSNPRQIVGMTNTATGVTQGGGMTTYDPVNHLYFQVGINGAAQLKLFVINSKTAEVIYQNDFTMGPFEGPFFMEKHSIEKLMYDIKNDQLLALIRDELLPSNVVYISAENRLEIFPNPTADYLQLKWKEKKVNSVSITNAVGQTIFSKKINANNLAEQLDVRHLNAGNYYLISFLETGEAAVQKFIKFE